MVGCGPDMLITTVNISVQPNTKMTQRKILERMGEESLGRQRAASTHMTDSIEAYHGACPRAHECGHW